MRHRHERNHDPDERWADDEPGADDEPVDWPESSLDVDDEAFARAIAEGRRAHVAA